MTYLAFNLIYSAYYSSGKYVVWGNIWYWKSSIIINQMFIFGVFIKWIASKIHYDYLNDKFYV